MGSHSLDERLRLAALVLKVAANYERGVHRSQLEKLTIQKHPKQCATHSKFEGAFGFLIRNGYLIRISRGVYKITPEGARFMESAPK